MKDYIQILNTNDKGREICISLDIGREEVRKIGEKIEKINECAYMNGYNWDIFLNYYLSKFYPSISESMERDPESGMYFVNFSDKNILKAKKFTSLIRYLIANEEEIYDFIKKEGDYIEWD